jgi:carbamoyltransferase
VYILGINAYHAGASACLLQNGQLIAAAEEERFNRVTHWAGFPSDAIRYCLSEAGITIGDLDHLAVACDPSSSRAPNGPWHMRSPSRFLPRRGGHHQSADGQPPSDALLQSLGVKRANFRARFHRVDHHRSHLASAFFTSPFSQAAVVSLDDVGDDVSTMWGVGNDHEIRLLGRIELPHSLGLFAQALTQWLGFMRYGDEDKLVDLAAYGEPLYLDEMRRIVRLHRDGTFELNLDLFRHAKERLTVAWDDGTPSTELLFSREWVNLLGAPRHPHQTETDSSLEGFTQYQLDVAASGQAMLELAELNLVRAVQKATGQRNLCMAGSLALNRGFNGKVRALTPFEQMYVQPAAGDAGTAMGVAYHIYHQLLGHARRPEVSSPYTGPQFDDDEIAHMLRGYGLSAWTADDDELIPSVAELLAGGWVVGWFQGRMEWGPRPLGNRSVLADPRRPGMVDVLRGRSKQPEPFRPFGASILSDATADYCVEDSPSPYMSQVYEMLPEQQCRIPAVTHVDGTARLQTVDGATNPRYWHLIRAFEEQTGVPLVLNTSFNENEPIICEPEQAIQSFLRTRMDALVLGNQLVARR